MSWFYTRCPRALHLSAGTASSSSGPRTAPTPPASPPGSWSTCRRCSCSSTTIGVLLRLLLLLSQDHAAPVACRGPAMVGSMACYHAMHAMKRGCVGCECMRLGPRAHGSRLNGISFHALIHLTDSCCRMLTTESRLVSLNQVRTMSVRCPLSLCILQLVSLNCVGFCCWCASCRPVA